MYSKTERIAGTLSLFEGMCISTGGDLEGLTDNGLTTGLCGDRRNGWECVCTAVDVLELNRHDVHCSRCLTSDRME